MNKADISRQNAIYAMDEYGKKKYAEGFLDAMARCEQSVRNCGIFDESVVLLRDFECYRREVDYE